MQKLVETDSKVKFNSVNEFTVGLLKHFDERKLFILSMSESCLRKWQREASDCFSWFLIFMFLPQNSLILYYFGFPVWKVGRNKLGGQ